MKTIIISTLSIIMLFFTADLFAQQEETAQQQTSLSEQEKKYREWARSLWESIEVQTGTIELPGDIATLALPENFYYLKPADATKVLVDIWGNPPGMPTLGMIFPQQYTPFDSSAWGVNIQYEEDGYVSDDDADHVDYRELLTQMQQDARSISQERVKNGYEAIELVGWAAPPFYDKDSKKLHWAKELKFGSDELNTLNYNIRVLGRKGVLVLNFIAGMDQLNEINTNLDSVLALANFNEGFRYQDFDPQLDKVAAYGIGALIAGKVLSKAGLFAIALVFLKKFWIFLAIAIGAAVKILFKGKKTQKNASV